MPLKLDVKRRFLSRSARVKCVNFHPFEPWMLASLHNGYVKIWNYNLLVLMKSFAVSEFPVRAGKFVARKNWFITGSDDLQIRIYNYNTWACVHKFDAHTDFIRSIVIHPTQPFILTSSDDILIKLWNWEKQWNCAQVFEGHRHYVMELVINPKDNNTFASACLDRTVKVWHLGSNTPNYTLEGHKRGVNSVDYYHGDDKPYLVSGGDDRVVKIWDYQNKTCIQSLDGHTFNIDSVLFHPDLPIIITGAEDGTVRIWNVNTYRLENTLKYNLERVWTVACMKGSNYVAIGCDHGSVVIKIGSEEPAISMDSSGKIIWAKYSELQQANLKAIDDADIEDGEILPLVVKDMGSCEIYPHTISHNSNGRFVVVCGDGEYIIYTAMALRNKGFGSALEFVWSLDSSEFAVRESSTSIKIFENFKEKRAFKPEYDAEAVFGGPVLGVTLRNGIVFYDWETLALIRRFEIRPKHIFWSKSGELVCIATPEAFYILRYNSETVIRYKQLKTPIPEDGIEQAFNVLHQRIESVKTGLWVGDCFVYTNAINRLNYYIGREIVIISHLDRVMYLLGYISKDSRLYLTDKEFNIVSYSFLSSVVEYQTAVLRGDFESAHSILRSVPRGQHTRIAHFLERQGFKSRALVISTDPDHKFELALQLQNLEVAYSLAKDAMSERKWKQLAELTIARCAFKLSEECFYYSKDYERLLLLATSSGNASMLEKMAQSSEMGGINNIAFISYFLLGKKEKALNMLLQTGRLPEAAFFAHTYLPSHVPRIVKLWKDHFKKVNKKASLALVNPEEYANLFPGLQSAVKAEQFIKQNEVPRSAVSYPYISHNTEKDPIKDMQEAEEAGKFVYLGNDEATEIQNSLSEDSILKKDLLIED